MSDQNSRAPVSTALYIGGQERETSDVLEVMDPAKPDRVVGTAAAASEATSPRRSRQQTPRSVTGRRSRHRSALG